MTHTCWGTYQKKIWSLLWRSMETVWEWSGVFRVRLYCWLHERQFEHWHSECMDISRQRWQYKCGARSGYPNGKLMMTVKATVIVMIAMVVLQCTNQRSIRRKNENSFMEEKNDRIESIISSLREKHGDKFSMIQYRMWSELIDNGKHKQVQ